MVENKGEVIAFNGYIRSWVDNLIVNFFWLNTIPNYMNKGIGSKLMKDLIKRIKDSKEKPKAKIITISWSRQGRNSEIIIPKNTEKKSTYKPLFKSPKDVRRISISVVIIFIKLD